MWDRLKLLLLRPWRVIQKSAKIYYIKSKSLCRNRRNCRNRDQSKKYFLLRLLYFYIAAAAVASQSGCRSHAAFVAEAVVLLPQLKHFYTSSFVVAVIIIILIILRNRYGLTWYHSGERICLKSVKNKIRFLKGSNYLHFFRCFTYAELFWFVFLFF